MLSSMLKRAKCRQWKELDCENIYFCNVGPATRLCQLTKENSERRHRIMFLLNFNTTYLMGSVVISRKKAADTGSLLSHFICFSLRSIIYEANREELYNSRVERLLAEYLIDTPLLEFLPLLFMYAR